MITCSVCIAQEGGQLERRGARCYLMGDGESTRRKQSEETGPWQGDKINWLGDGYDVMQRR